MSSFAAFSNKYLLLLLAYCPIWCRRSCIIFFRWFSIRYKFLVYIFFLGFVFILETISMILCFNPSLFIWAFCPPGSEKTPFVFLLIFSKLILPQDFPTTELLGHSFSGIPNWWQVPIAISTFQIIFLCPMTRTYLQLKEAIWVWSSIVFNSSAACWCHCSGNSIGCTAFKTAKLFFPTKKNPFHDFWAEETRRFQWLFWIWS